MKLRFSNLANGSTIAGFTPGMQNFPWKKRGFGHVSDVTLLKVETPFNIFGMDEATLFEFGKWIDYSKSHPSSKNFPSPKKAWSGSRDRFSNLNPFNISRTDEATLFKFGKWIDTASPAPRVKKFHPKEAWSGSRDRFWYEATLFKFRTCIDYGQCHTRN